MYISEEKQKLQGQKCSALMVTGERRAQNRSVIVTSSLQGDRENDALIIWLQMDTLTWQRGGSSSLNSSGGERRCSSRNAEAGL